MQDKNFTISLSEEELKLIVEALWHYELENDKNSQKVHIKHLRTSIDLFLKKKQECKDLKLKLER